MRGRAPQRSAIEQEVDAPMGRPRRSALAGKVAQPALAGKVDHPALAGKVDHPARAGREAARRLSKWDGCRL